MGKLIRLDKYLADLRIGSRKEVKDHIKKGKVKVNNQVIKSPAHKVKTDTDKVYFEQKELNYREYVYFMLNKPRGVVSATKDNFDETVIDLIDKAYQKDIFPVGRLDKDTEGLLLITDDGDLAHKLLTPNNKVPKTYYALVEGRVTEQERLQFEQGIRISDEFIALPAHLDILKSGERSEVYLTIYEGKFHQVKRMFKSLDMEVSYLKRVSMGSLVLDESLELGEYRLLTDEELMDLKK